MKSSKRKSSKRKAIEKVVEERLADPTWGLLCLFCKEVVATVRASHAKRALDQATPLLPGEVSYIMAKGLKPGHTCVSCPFCCEDVFDYNKHGGFNIYPAHLQVQGERPERFPKFDGRSPGLFLSNPYSSDPYGFAGRFLYQVLDGIG